MMTSSHSREGTIARTGGRRIPRGIWVLGLVSMCMDVSSELIHSVLPVLLATTLGASMATIGLVEGVAEATASITKVFSGAISDRLGRRKPLAVLGYGLAALTKPVFALAPTVGWVAAARFTDRVGKGIRGAPRDALVAEIAPAEVRGAAFGLRQALDSVGAFLGPAAALVLLMFAHLPLRTVLWVAVAPAWLAVALLSFGVREPEAAPAGPTRSLELGRERIRRLSRRFWVVVVLGAVFTLARFSEAFLVLRAQDVGLSLAAIPLVLIVMNVVYSATSYPAGALADRLSPKRLLILGLLPLIGADLVLALAGTPVAALVGAGLWGVHMGMTQGLFAKLVADTAGADLRGTAFGLFNLVSGVSLLAASVVAGELWSRHGPRVTFVVGATFAATCLLGVASIRFHGQGSAIGDSSGAN